MERTINMGDRDVRVEMSADTLRVYRKTFGRDLMVDMVSLRDNMDLEIVENLFYVCAKAADPDIPDIDEWLAQFSTFAIYHSAGDLVEMWIEESKTTTTRKKKADQ